MEHQGDVRRFEVNGREVVLIGTAHVSKESVSTVEETIRAERPDSVCVELDQRRYDALRDKAWWESLDLFEVFKKGQAPFLLANLVLSSYQKRMGMATGVKPGAELAAAAAVGEEVDAKVELCDRDIRTTLLRIWRMTPWYKKLLLASSLLASVFGFGEQQEISEESLKELRQTDALTLMLDEMGETFPSIKRALVDERDIYMAARIREAPGPKVVAVVGAAHVPGICNHIMSAPDPDEQAEIDTIPERSLIARLIPYIIPAIVVGLFIYGFTQGDTSKVGDALVAWVVANGALSALGALIARGHPLTIIAAFIAAPITSLNPTIGAGFVTGIVQTRFAPPLVRDMENLSDDIAEFKGWWTNRLARVLLVFALSSFGSAIGTFVAFGWLKNLVPAG